MGCKIYLQRIKTDKIKKGDNNFNKIDLIITKKNKS